ncbi:hypothetical protein [Paraburkholderia sp. UCT31]|uniref:hypothetical protein n=2 Tax=unclassified Paraburkholderia TaxID=2615204 RepID=UPI001655E15F|nr:hypothetical protein [Paraburkholderia sp. UCT31]
MTEITRPYELNATELDKHLDAMVSATFADISSEFLILPKGTGFLPYTDFRQAFEVLKRQTRVFEMFDLESVSRAVDENSRVFGVIRSILGMSPPEWAELANAESDIEISQTAARQLDRECRLDSGAVRNARERYASRVSTAEARRREPPPQSKFIERVDALLAVAIRYISEGAPEAGDAVVHRLDKFDTTQGLESVEYAARENVPYAAVLYERYLGRPFATHRDAVSELVGEVMENAVEEVLRGAGVTYRKTKRAERIPGFGQAPDFCIPDDVDPVVVIEAKITSDDGTARDKVARIKVLANQRDERIRRGGAPYEVVACIDGRGFRQRRADMGQMLTELNGKVFTTATLEHLLTHTRIREFVAIPRPGDEAV